VKEKAPTTAPFLSPRFSKLKQLGNLRGTGAQPCAPTALLNADFSRFYIAVNSKFAR
jgi:hypothetical protein